MGNNIIDSIDNLLDLSQEELDEKLIEEKYNKPNMRELIRRLLKKIKEYDKAYKYQVSEKEKVQEELRILKDRLTELQ